MATFSREQLKRVFERARDANLQLQRHELMAGIPKPIVGAIHMASTPLGQLWTDLHHLDELQVLTDGTRPLKTWLDNAATLLTELHTAHEFFLAMAIVAAPHEPFQPPPPPSPSAPPQLLWYSQKQAAGIWVIYFSDAFNGVLGFAQRLSNGRVVDAALSTVAGGTAIIAASRDAVDVLVSQEAVTLDDTVLPLRRSAQPLSPPAPGSQKPSGRP